MTLRTFDLYYSVYACWGPRGETPEELAERYGPFIDGLADLSPFLAQWRVGIRPRLYKAVRDDLASFFRANVRRDDFGVPCPDEGYSVIGLTFGSKSYSCGLQGSVGGSAAYNIPNHLEIEASAMAQDSVEFATYSFYRTLLLKTVRAWAPGMCSVQPDGLMARLSERGIFQGSWIIYIPATLAPSVVPPDVPVVETLPDGSLLLAATTEMFQTDNPDHLGAAKRIGQAVFHLNDNPWAGSAITPLL